MLLLCRLPFVVYYYCYHFVMLQAQASRTLQHSPQLLLPTITYLLFFFFIQYPIHLKPFLHLQPL